jgi:hypothetical protein
MTQVEQFELVQNAIRDALKSFVGKPPDRAELMRFVGTHLSSLSHGDVSVNTDALAAILALEWLPYQDRKGYDIKKMVRSLDRYTLDWLVKQLHGNIIGTASLVFLEQMYRDGLLGGDWEVEQSEIGMNATFVPKQALNYVRMDFVLTPGSA